jgi:hypothetical protein
MKNKKFFNLDQALRYLSESVITFKGKPIYVYGIDTGRYGKNFQLFYYDVGEGEPKTVLSDNTDIDMNPVPLGLTAIKDRLTEYSSGMVTRMALRSYKIGLTRQNVNIANCNPKATARYKNRYADFMCSKELRDTVLGNYPKYSECLKASQEGGTTLAFSRRFAVSQDQLFYKALGVPVGLAKKSGPELDENCFFLKEALEEDFKNAQ